MLETTKYIRVFSDVHLDMNIPKKGFKPDQLWMPEEMPEDKHTTLLLVGDIWHAKKPYSYAGYSWMKELSSRFQYIVFVLGNHDFWGGNLPKEYMNNRKYIEEQKLENVFLLQNTTLIIGDIKFIGATLWTDFLMGSAVAMNLARERMNDYKYMTFGPNFTHLSPKNILGEHIKSRSYIFDNSQKDYPEQKLIVLSHHVPSYLSMDKEDNTDDKKYENSLDFSDLDTLIEKSEIDIWFHGHSHIAKNYNIGLTKIMANPRGYPGEETGYDPNFRLLASTLQLEGQKKLKLT